METGTPCRLCKERNRVCTFDEPPGRRKRPAPKPLNEFAAQTTPSALSPNTSSFDAGMQPCAAVAQPHNDIPMTAPFAEPSMAWVTSPVIPSPDSMAAIESSWNSNPSLGLHTLANAIPALQTQQPFQHRQASQHLPPTTSTPYHSLPSPIQAQPPRTTLERNLEAQPNVTYRAIGLTGDLDLIVLSHRKYDEHNESSVQYRGLRYRRMSSIPTSGPMIPPQVFMVIDNDCMAPSQPKLGGTEADKARQQLQKLLPSQPKLIHRLVLLYAHYVHPNFPILAARQLPSDPDKVQEALPPALLAAVVATAVPFVTYDDVLSVWLPDCPSEADLFQIAWVLVTAELHTPQLSTIQTYLLLLQRHAMTTGRYVPNSPIKPTLMSTTIALCHCLGLHRDPSTWEALPVWERRLRRRVWWAAWTMEKWISLGESVPSALRADDYDVEPLDSLDDMEDLADTEDAVAAVHELALGRRPPTSPGSAVGVTESHRFPHLVSLTAILSDVMQTFFTVRATAQTSTDLSLSLELAKPLRRRLKQWHDALPRDIRGHVTPALGRDTGTVQPQERRQRPPTDSFCRLSASGSFYLAYLTVQLTLFRALLRPVSSIASTWLVRETSEGSENTEDMGETEYEPSSGLGDENSAEEGDLSDEQISAIKAVIKGALAVMNEVVQFAEYLGASEWDAFWHSWSRTNFAVIAGVMLNLVFILRPPISLTASKTHVSLKTAQPHLQPNTTSFLHLQDDYKRLLDYLTRWRWSMKIASRGAGGHKGLMNLSLLRLDALMSELSSA